MSSATTHELHCLANADHFTAARGRGATRTVERAKTLAAAEAIAQGHGDGRTMIYAVTGDGSVAHIKNA